MKIRPFNCMPAMVALSLAILGLGLACLEPQHSNYLEHQDQQTPDYRAE
jgi:hypothetical protein